MAFVTPDWALPPPPNDGQRAFLLLLHKAELAGTPAELLPGRVEEETLHIAGVVWGSGAHLDPLVWPGWVAIDRSNPARPLVRLTDTGRGFLT